MADIVSPSKRSQMMAGIKAANTKPEMIIRRGLHSLGFRYRLHAKGLPGKPDLVFPKYNAVILVHGCFWHGHGCALFKWPTSKERFWREKIGKNHARDLKTESELASQGWRILKIWECSLKGRNKLGTKKVIEQAAAWLQSDNTKSEIMGSGN